MAKHIFITGGVVSSLGKGIAAASLGRLLKARGYSVTMQKCDPYLNIDPGTMSPFQHGEVFVTEDGHEGDLDLGHYERFIDEALTRESNFTAGSIYQALISSERHGDFLGGTVQVVPHMTNAIAERFERIAYTAGADIVITEIGGTVGDIESLPFLEAARQFKMKHALEDVLFIHLTLVPYIAAASEVKTKPTQHSVKELRSIGIQPDFIVCRSDHEVTEKVRAKISLFCDVVEENVLSCEDAPSIYEVPLKLLNQGFDTKVLKRLDLDERRSDLTDWNKYVNSLHEPAFIRKPLRVAIVGKYVQLPDAYLSVIEAVGHAGVSIGRKAVAELVDGESLLAEGKNNVAKSLDGYDAIIVPGGFGSRAFEGKIAAVNYARENKIPFLGICLGLHASVVEFSRNVAELKDANSAEFKEELKADLHYPVIDLMPDQNNVTDKGGTMRLGSYPCTLEEGSLALKLYKEPIIYERHRHRYEVNNAFRARLQKHGMLISGQSPDNRLVEMIELPPTVHPYFIATQAHPEFKSRPTRPHPLFKGLVIAAGKHADGIVA